MFHPHHLTFYSVSVCKKHCFNCTHQSTESRSGCLIWYMNLLYNSEGKHEQPLKGPVHSPKQSRPPSVISVHACVCMCATAITKVPAAMREVLAVVGGTGGWETNKREAEDTALCSFFLPPPLFREPWPQAGACAFSGLRECELCVRLSPGCTRDQRALPLSNNSPALAWGGWA